MIITPVQTLKNALSPYRLGGASGGSDFDPKGKSDNEVLTSLVKLVANNVLFMISKVSITDVIPMFVGHAVLSEFYE